MAVVHGFLAELAGRRLAVMVVSSEIPEFLDMSDQAIVMRKVRIVRAIDKHLHTPERSVRHAAGIPEAAV